MSSSTDRLAPPTHVLRNAETRPMPALTDLDSLSGASRRAVDPAVTAEAEARGYADGRASGYEDGFVAGRQAAIEAAAESDRERVDAIERALGALARAVTELDARVGADLTAAEDALVGGAFDLATAVIGRELALAAAPGRDALARALRLADGQEAALVRLHPDDVATLGDHAELAPGRDFTVVADPGVERGDCLMELGDGLIDARIATAIARVEQVLAP